MPLQNEIARLPETANRSASPAALRASRHDVNKLLTPLLIACKSNSAMRAEALVQIRCDDQWPQKSFPTASNNRLL